MQSNCYVSILLMPLTSEISKHKWWKSRILKVDYLCNQKRKPLKQKFNWKIMLNKSVLVDIVKTLEDWNVFGR